MIVVEDTAARVANESAITEPIKIGVGGRKEEKRRGRGVGDGSDDGQRGSKCWKN